MYIFHYISAEKLIKKIFTLVQDDKLLPRTRYQSGDHFEYDSFHIEITHIQNDPFWPHFWAISEIDAFICAGLSSAMHDPIKLN